MATTPAAPPLRISELPISSELTGAELIPVVQAGVTAQATVTAIRAGTFTVANRLSELASDPTAQAAAQTNLGLGAVDPLAYYILAKS